MKTLVASSLVLGILTPAALAEPVALTEAEMDHVRAGQRLDFHPAGVTTDTSGPSC